MAPKSMCFTSRGILGGLMRTQMDSIPSTDKFVCNLQGILSHIATRTPPPFLPTRSLLNFWNPGRCIALSGILESHQISVIMAT